MHIMFIDEYKMVNYTGGIEKVFCYLANAFVNKGYEVTIICLDTERGVPAYHLNDKVNFINLCYDIEKCPYITMKYFIKKGEKEILRAFGGSDMVFRGHHLQDPKRQYFWDEFVKRLKYCIEKLSPDVLLCSSIDSTYYVQKIINYEQIPIVSMCHMDVDVVIKSSSQKLLNSWKKATVVQVLLEKYASIVLAHGIDNIVCIPNVVEETSVVKQANLSECNYKIISVGRVEESIKRHYLLIQAFAKIADKYPKWTLHIWGEIDNRNYKARLDNIIRKNKLESRVILEGVSSNIFYELKNSDIFALPSASEGFGLALTEAMSVGLPSVGYKSCTAVSELIHDGLNGFLCDDGVDDFSNKLSMLIDNQDMRIQMGNFAKKSVSQFKPDIILSEWENLFQYLISHKSIRNFEGLYKK